MANQNDSEEREANFDASSGSLEEERRREQVYKKIGQWKNYLLDLTRRNRLLYFTPTRQTTIPITSPSAQEIFNKLVKKGRTLKFPLPKQERQIMLPLPSEEKSTNHVQIASDIKSVHLGDLETSLELQELQRKLYRLRRDWRTWQEEQGIHTLFLAIGMLHWKESPQEQEECLAPLILVPVGLQKEGLNKPFLLEFVEEDIIINPVLRFKLEMDYDIHLPEFPEEMDEFEVDKYLKQVGEFILSQGWNVSEEVWLGRFSFVKFVMYQDLHNHREDASQHSIVASLAGDNSLLPLPADVPGLDRLDETLNVQEVFPVLDADSSQLEILARARQGQNMVVQGPPGTGKSQTIVNLIAQSLREQKKVLFVSEKMAALEVVYHRLHELGLSFACLEVHSHRSNKSKVIAELGRSLQQYIKNEVPRDVEDRFNSLIRKRNVLNQYVRELHTPRGKQQLTAYQVHGKLAQLANMPNLEFNLPKNILEHSSTQRDELQDVIRRLAQVPEVVDNFDGHPWTGAKIDPKVFSLQKRDQLLNAVESLDSGIDSIEQVVQPLVKQIGLKPPETLKRTEELAELLAILAESQRIPLTWFALNPAKVRELVRDADSAKNHTETLFEARRKFSSCFSKKILKQPLPEIIQRFYSEYKSFFRWFKANYWREMRDLRSFWVGPRKMTCRAALEGLRAAVKVLNEESWFNKQKPKLEKAFQDLYKGEKTNWDSAKIGLEWVERLLKWFSPSSLPEPLVQLASKPNLLAENAQNVQTKLKEILDEMTESRTLIRQVFKGQGIKGFVLDGAPFSVLHPWLNIKKQPKDVDDWVEFLKAQVDCEKHGLSEFLKAALQKKIRVNQLEGAFLKRFWKGWLDEVYREVPILAEFRASRHKEIVQEFRKLDGELQKVTVAIVQETVQKKQPKRSAAMANDSQVGILLREVQKDDVTNHCAAFLLKSPIYSKS